MSKNSFEIPEDWVWTTMGDIADVVGGGTPKTNDPTNYDDGVIPWITPADLSGYTAKSIGRGARSITQKGLKASSARMIPAGSVLFTSRAPVGYVAVAANDVCTNQGFKSFVLKSKNILSDYVYWWLKGNKDLAESYASGTTFLELSGAKAKQLPIPIAPLEQQTRIVAEIEKQFSRLDEAVANLKRVKANLKRYKAAVLKAAVEGKLTREWRNAHPDVEPASELLKRILTERRAKWNGTGKYKEPVAPDTAEFWSLPRGWTLTTVSQLLIEPLCNGISVKGRETPPGVRALRLNAMSDSGFDYTEVRYLPLSESDVEDLWIAEGDFFISRGNGSLHLVGRGTSAQQPPEPTIFPDTMIRLRMGNEIRDSGWLRTIWPSRIVRSQIERKVKTTAGIYKIAQPEVEQITVPLPPLPEQEQIRTKVERRFSVLEALRAATQSNFHRADRLRQSLLAKAFSGALMRKIQK